MTRVARQRGLTLLEILVALLLTGITVALASYLFLGAKAQMWLRGRESQMLREAVYLRAAMEDSLQSGGLGCAQERITSLKPDGRLPKWTEAGSWKAKAPGLATLEIRCHEVASDLEADLRFIWRGELRYGKAVREVRGSWMP